MPELLDELHVRVFIAQHLKITTGWNTANVYSSFWRLYVNDKPGASALLHADGGAPYALSAQRVHFIPAWVRFTCLNTRDLSHTYVHFDLVGLPATVVRDVFARPFTLPRDPLLDQSVRAWVAEMKHAPATQLAALCRVKALVYQALGRLLDLMPQDQYERCCRHLLSKHAVSPATDYIDAHLDELLDNAALAALCHVSEDHFIRLFRQVVGQTPAQYILDRRVSAAAQRLIFSSDSIDAIAEQTGFRDRYYFSRVFAKRMGSPPAKYRKVDRV